ncbi:MAG TPA: lysophospholipid acyltransferase family protein [bacterium]|nr:lysophospholipid acyltransferase family protein [bacterium]
MRYAVLRWVMRHILRLFFGLTVTGTEHIPVRGPVILAANHPSQMDPLVLLAAVPRRFAVLAAAEVLTMPVIGPLVRPFRPVPIKRGRFDLGAIKECLHRLGCGDALLIFPEGKISTDGRLQPPHDGPAFIASRAGVPIIPIGVSGTYQVWPLGTRVPHRGQITVNVGLPIVPEGGSTRTDQGALTARVMAAIADLAGQACARTVSSEQSGVRDAAA